MTFFRRNTSKLQKSAVTDSISFNSVVKWMQFPEKKECIYVGL